MSKLARTTIVNASKSATWKVIKDFGGVHRWHLKVKTSPVLSTHNEGLGAKRVCNFYDGTSVCEEIVQYTDGASLTVELTEFAMPLKYATATLSVRELGPERTEVTLELDYQVKYGPVGWVMNNVMIQPMMGKTFAQVLDGLGHHLVTGETVGEQGITPAAA